MISFHLGFQFPTRQDRIQALDPFPLKHKANSSRKEKLERITATSTTATRTTATTVNGDVTGILKKDFSCLNKEECFKNVIDVGVMARDRNLVKSG